MIWGYFPPFRDSAIPSFRIWGDFPPFRDSAIPSFRHSVIPPFCRSVIPAFRVARVYSGYSAINFDINYPSINLRFKPVKPVCRVGNGVALGEGKYNNASYKISLTTVFCAILTARQGGQKLHRMLQNL